MGMQIPCAVHPEISKKSLYGLLKKVLGGVFHELAREKDSRIKEEHLMPDHVHMKKIYLGE